jgi:dCTP deaminase
MILTDREIQIGLRTKQIIVDPLPDANAYSSTTLDLTLGDAIRVFKKVVPGLHTVDPSADGYGAMAAILEITEQQTIEAGGFHLSPNTFVLMWTAEFIDLPITSRVAARVEGKSSLARLGVGVHVTAPTIHAGFQGRVQLEVFNHGPRTVILTPGMRICQLIFEQTLGVADKGYEGQFIGQGATAKAA